MVIWWENSSNSAKKGEREGKNNLTPAESATVQRRTQSLKGSFGRYQGQTQEEGGFDLEGCPWQQRQLGCRSSPEIKSVGKIFNSELHQLGD